MGIEFALSNNFEYQIYTDIGISGYKTDDDELNPFLNRPEFTSLINDIKSHKITKVWVYEHSRLSRKHDASAIIFSIFEKHNIELYENTKLIDLKDAQSQFLRQVMDAFSQLERNLIINRTTRGLHDAINRGKRGMPNLYGYRKNGKDSKGRIIWESDESQIEDLKFIFGQYLDGKSLRSICHSLYEFGRYERSVLLDYSKKISKYLSNYIYTGYALNMEGLDIFHKYNKMKIYDISILVDSKYWVKSIPYPIQIISIEDWIKVVERLHINKAKQLINMEKSRRTDKGLATGIIICSECGAKYFSYSGAYINKKHEGKRSHYSYYKHHVSVNDKICSHKPKSIKTNVIDEIFKCFFFFYYLVFSESNAFVQETMEKLKHDIQQKKKIIISNEGEIIKTRKQITKLNELLSDVTEKEVLRVTAKKIDSLENELPEKINFISNMKIELEKLQNKLSQTEFENTYINIKEKIKSFFTEMEIEDRRNELLQIIKKCTSFGDHILIDTGNMLFLFNIKLGITFDENLLNNLDKDEIYKRYFLTGHDQYNIEKQSYKEKGLIPIPQEIAAINDDYLFIDMDLDYQDYDVKNYLEYLNIDYDISTYEKFILSV